MLVAYKQHGTQKGKGSFLTYVMYDHVCAHMYVL